jgi:hypothetical protein
VESANVMGQGARTHAEREDEEDSHSTATVTEPPANNQQTEGNINNVDGSSRDAELDDEIGHAGGTEIDAHAQVGNTEAPDSPLTAGNQDKINGDLYDNDEYADEYADTTELSGDTPQQQGERASIVPPQGQFHRLFLVDTGSRCVIWEDTSYDEYEELEEVNDLAPESENPDGALVVGSEGHVEGTHTDLGHVHIGLLTSFSTDNSEIYYGYDDAHDQRKFSSLFQFIARLT